jgi:Ca2+-binding EF-hand superfamily protein
LKVIARHLHATEIQGTREMFEAMDKDGSGRITVDALREGLRKKGAQLALTEVSGASLTHRPLDVRRTNLTQSPLEH